MEAAADADDALVVAAPVDAPQAPELVLLHAFWVELNTFVVVPDHVEVPVQELIDADPEPSNSPGGDGGGDGGADVDGRPISAFSSPVSAAPVSASVP